MANSLATFIDFPTLLRILERRDDEVSNVAGWLTRAIGVMGTTLVGEGKGASRRFSRDEAEVLRERLRRGRGPQTAAHYLGAVKQFTKWLAKDRRAADNPFSHLAIARPDADRHDRRALTHDELTNFLTAAIASAKVFRGMTGSDRHILYATACATGFRKGELAQLTPESFSLDSEPSCTFLGASQTKNKKTAQQPLPPDVAEALRL